MEESEEYRLVRRIRRDSFQIGSMGDDALDVDDEHRRGVDHLLMGLSPRLVAGRLVDRLLVRASMDP
jgi:hypothetical protein